MQKVISSCDKAKSIVDSLLSLMEEAGGTCHDNITFDIVDGNLSINSNALAQPNELLLNIPLTCMPLLRDYKFSLKRDHELVATLTTNAINPNANEVMQLMVALYNSANKLKQWRNVFPFIALKNNREIVNKLFAFRPQGQKLTSFKEALDHEMLDELLISSFLGSREFTYKSDALNSAGVKTSNSSEKGLLAVIDFLNHRMGNSGYQINRNTGCMEIKASKDNQLGEIFVQYGFMDALQTYLTYGFVDVCAPIYYSGRMQFKLLSGANFVVMSMSGSIQSTIPLSAKLSHLKNYMPAGIKRDGINIVVSDLVVPDKSNKGHLKECLEVVLKQCDREGIYKKPANLKIEIKHIETQLINRNILFWNNFKVYIESIELSLISNNEQVKNDLLLLSDTCTKICKNYASLHNISVA